MACHTWPHLASKVTELASSAAFFDPSDKSARRAIGEVIRAQRGVRSSGAQALRRSDGVLVMA